MHPLAVEQLLPLLQQWTSHLDHHFMPVLVGFLRIPELIGQASVAHMPLTTNYQQDRAMITVQVAKPQTQRQRVVQTQLYARDSQPLAACLAHLQATKRVEQTAYPHTTQRSGLQ